MSPASGRVRSCVLPSSTANRQPRKAQDKAESPPVRPRCRSVRSWNSINRRTSRRRCRTAIRAAGKASVKPSHQTHRGPTILDAALFEAIGANRQRSPLLSRKGGRPNMDITITYCGE